MYMADRRSSAATLHHRAALWCVVLLLCLAVRIRAQSQDLYGKVGDSVVLIPDVSSVTEPITSISWKHGDHLAVEWDLRDGGIVEAFRQFRGQATLNITTAELKISGLTGNFSGKYEVEVNGKPIYSRVLQVIFPVSKPTISWKCDKGLTSCLLSCDGAAAQDQVIWRRDGVQTETDLAKQLNITKDRDADYKEFTCVLKNQVSEESSDPVVNPLSSEAPDVEKPVEGQKWMTGLTVFISLLAVLVVLALVHRWKAGFWFYDTEFMPWEAGFWRTSEKAGADEAANGRASLNAEAAESNGTNAAREQRRHEEDDLMAETAIP